MERRLFQHFVAINDWSGVSALHRVAAIQALVVRQEPTEVELLILLAFLFRCLDFFLGQRHVEIAELVLFDREHAFFL